MTTTETELERTIRQEQNDYDTAIDGTESGPDADAGKLFDVPRVKVVVDESDPNVLKVAFAGGVELDRGKPDEVGFYNQLKAGKSMDLEITVHVAGAKTSHHRDSDGNVDSIVQTKSLIVTDLVYRD